MKQYKEFTIIARAFAGDDVKTHTVRVEGGIVRVWDEVAGYFTTCHSLSPAVTKRIVHRACHLLGARP